MAANNKGAARINMGSISKLAGAAIVEGQVVEMGADFDHVVKCPDKNSIQACGVAMNSAAAEEPVEVQFAGVGLVLGEAAAAITITDMLVVAATDGQVEAVNGAGPQVVVGSAMRTQTIGAAAELIPVRLMFAIDG